jgi:hypothetical protein
MLIKCGLRLFIALTFLTSLVASNAKEPLAKDTNGVIPDLV